MLAAGGVVATPLLVTRSRGGGGRLSYKPLGVLDLNRKENCFLPVMTKT